MMNYFDYFNQLQICDWFLYICPSFIYTYWRCKKTFQLSFKQLQIREWFFHICRTFMIQYNVFLHRHLFHRRNISTFIYIMNHAISIILTNSNLRNSIHHIGYAFSRNFPLPSVVTFSITWYKDMIVQRISFSPNDIFTESRGNFQGIGGRGKRCRNRDNNCALSS